MASPQRESVTPEVPTIAEQGLTGFDVSVWSAIVAPKGTPPAVLQTLNASVQKALATEEIKTEMKKIGATPLSANLAETNAFLHKESARWGKVIKDAGVKID